MPEITKTFLTNGISLPDDVIYTTSVEFTLEVLKAMDAVTILPRTLVLDHIACGQLKILGEKKFSWYKPVTLLYSREQSKPAALVSVISLLHQTAPKVTTHFK